MATPYFAFDQLSDQMLQRDVTVNAPMLELSDKFGAYSCANEFCCHVFSVPEYLLESSFVNKLNQRHRCVIFYLSHGSARGSTPYPVHSKRRSLARPRLVSGCSFFPLAGESPCFPASGSANTWPILLSRNRQSAYVFARLAAFVLHLSLVRVVIVAL